MEDEETEWGEKYYVCQKTGVSQWEKPLVEHSEDAKLFNEHLVGKEIEYQPHGWEDVPPPLCCRLRAKASAARVMVRASGRSTESSG